MKDSPLRDRTKQFALRVIRLFTRLPKTTEAQVLGKQLLRSGTSVAANYREACRSRSNAELIAKLGIVEQELDESMLWFALLGESGILKAGLLAEISDEAEQLLKMTIASIKTIRRQK